MPSWDAIQNVNFETNPCADLHRVLVYISKTRLLSHPDSPPLQTVLEIRIRGGGLPIYSPSIRTLSGSAYLYEACRRCYFPLWYRWKSYLNDWLVLGMALSRVRLENQEHGSLIQGRVPSSPQEVSKHTGPHYLIRLHPQVVDYMAHLQSSRCGSLRDEREFPLPDSLLEGPY